MASKTSQEPAFKLERSADELYKLAAVLETQISTAFDLIGQLEDLQHGLPEHDE